MKTLKKLLGVLLSLCIALSIFSCMTFEAAQLIAGDLTGDGAVTRDDAIYVLYHSMYPEQYPANQDADFDEDGNVDREDAIYLLYHSMYPEQYPLPEVGGQTTATATGTFSCRFVDNDWDSYCVDVTGNVEHCWGTTFPDITSLITSICDLEDVYYLEVEVTPSNTDKCAKGVSPRCELHWDSRAGDQGDSQGLTDGTIYLSAFPPEYYSKVILNPYAFSAEAGVIDFEVTVRVTIGSPTPDVDDPDSATQDENKTGDPEMTSFTIANNLTPSQNLGLSVNKLSQIYKPSTENNPISSNVFFADPTSVEYNGRLYVYGTNDTQQFKANGGTGENGYGNINSLVCYSSADLVNWTYHGEIPVTKIATWAGCSWAPSIVSRQNGDKTEFFLYFCNSGGGVGVLTSDSPLGPWKDPIGGALVHNGMLGSDPVCWCFDPGVVIDDNGVGWIAIGGGDPMHSDETSMYTGNCRFAKLGDDMVSIASDFIKIPAVHHFEANEINYINGTYVLTYCSNYGARDQWTSDLGTPSNACSMCYMVCKGDPLVASNWKYGGEYLTNPNTYGYPFSNNHSHLHKFGGKYYILYQTVSLLENMGKLSTAGGYRSIGIDEIQVDEANVVINKGKMTDKGVEKVANVNAFAVLKAETHHSAAGIDYRNDNEMGFVVTDIDDGDYIVIKNVSFKNGADAFAAIVKGKGIIDIRLNSANGVSVGSIQFDTDSFKAITCELNTTVDSLHDLYLVFGGDFEFDSWQFAYLG